MNAKSDNAILLLYYDWDSSNLYASVCVPFDIPHIQIREQVTWKLMEFGKPCLV